MSLKGDCQDPIIIQADSGNQTVKKKSNAPFLCMYKIFMLLDRLRQSAKNRYKEKEEKACVSRKRDGFYAVGDERKTVCVYSSSCLQTRLSFFLETRLRFSESVLMYISLKLLIT